MREVWKTPLADINAAIVAHARHNHTPHNRKMNGMESRIHDKMMARYKRKPVAPVAGGR